MLRPRAWALLAPFIAMPAETALAQTMLPGIEVTAPAEKRRRAKISPTPRRTKAQPAERRVAARPATRSPSRAAGLPPASPRPPLPATPTPVPDRPFTSISTATPSEILASGGASLGETLADKPGVSTTAFSPMASRPVIRGLGGFRVRTQENGIGSGDMANLGEDHAVTIDPLTSGKVEIIRGPGTLRYGSQAIGGVISASNERIPTSVPPRFVEFETRGGFSSVSNGYDGAAILKAGAGNFALHADASRRSADDYRTPAGRQLNSSYDATGYSFGGSYIFDTGFVGASVQKSLSTYFIPGSDAALARNHIELDQTKYASRGEFRIGEFGIDTVKYWLGYTDYRHLEVDGLGAARDVGSTFVNRELESRLEVSHLPWNTFLGEARGTVGLQYGRRRLSVGGSQEPLLEPATNTTMAAFLFEELKLTERLRLQGAMRVEQTSIRGTGALFPATYLPPPNDPTLFPVSRRDTPTSFSAGLLYDLPMAVTARLTAQHVERSPDPIELFYKGPHDTPRTFEIGDPGLKLERANTIELGFSKAEGAFRFDVSGYYAKFSNFIFKNFTGFRCNDTFASCGPVGSFDQIVYSQRNASFLGAEGQMEYDFVRVGRGVVGLSSQFDVVHASFSDGGAVPKIPPFRLGGGLYYRDGQLTARISLLHAFAVNRLASFETRTPGYDLLNAELSYTTRMTTMAGAPVATFGIRGENLLNERIRLHQSYKKDEVLQPGANIRLFTTVKF